MRQLVKNMYRADVKECKTGRNNGKSILTLRKQVSYITRQNLRPILQLFQHIKGLLLIAPMKNRQDIKVFIPAYRWVIIDAICPRLVQSWVLILALVRKTIYARWTV